MIKASHKKGMKIMSTTYAQPKSRIDTLRKAPTRRPPENNLRNIETRVKAGKGDTYQLLKIKKDIRAMV